MVLFFIILITSLLTAGLVFVLVLLKNKYELTRLGQSLQMTLFYIAFPRYEKQETPRTKEIIQQSIEGMEQVLARFLYLKRPNILKQLFLGEEVPRVVLEVASEVGGSDISFYVAVPDYLESGLEKNVQAVYPQAMVQKIPQDYTVFEPKGKTMASTLYLQNDFFFPIQTYKTLETDPLSGIVNALSKITEEEGAAVQVILRPCSFNLKKSAEKLLHNITREGKSIESALKESQRSKVMDWSAEFGKALISKPKDETQNQPQEQSEMNVEAIKSKIRKPIMEANVRILAVASEDIRAKEILGHLEDAFSQYISVVNGFVAKTAKRKLLKKLIYNFTFRNFNKAERIILNLEEIASVYHFPLPHISAAHIKWAGAKESAPPSEMPKETAGFNVLGKAIFRGDEKLISFSTRDDRRRHFYIIGQTGVGKSSLLKEMIRHDLENGEGVAVIDPNGDLVEDTLANIPKERAEDVVLFEPFDLQRPLGLNMLEWKTPEQKDFAISEMITIFSKLFPPEIIGPMFEHYMRNAMLALMADKDNPGTLVDIPRIFMDKDFMEEKLMSVDDPLVKSFWQKEWSTATGQTKSDMLGYVVSKVGRFVENEMMRNIIGQAKSSFDLGEIMDQKKIFLANLSKGQTGEMNSSLLGLILVSKMQIAAFRRANIPQENRQDFYLYIDEFQNFTTDSIAIILSEARKYRLNLILAHQFMPQLTEQIRNAVIGNVGSIATFRVGADDAEFLEKQFEPEFSKFDLLNIDNFNFILKMMLNNKVSRPFRAIAIKPKEGNHQLGQSIKQFAKLKYGRAKEEVSREIQDRARLGSL